MSRTRQVSLECDSSFQATQSKKVVSNETVKKGAWPHNQDEISAPKKVWLQ